MTQFDIKTHQDRSDKNHCQVQNTDPMSMLQYFHLYHSYNLLDTVHILMLHQYYMIHQDMPAVTTI